jgi:hypothetical protein
MTEPIARVDSDGSRMDGCWSLRFAKFPILTTDCKKVTKETLDFMAIQLNAAYPIAVKSRYVNRGRAGLE